MFHFSPYYRPQTPPPEEDSLRDETRSSLHRSAFNSKSSSPSSQEFNLESFNCHREQLMEMHREQEALLLNQDSPSTVAASNHGAGSGNDLQRSFSSQPTSRFTLDSASAQFAVTAVIDSAQLETNVVKGGEATSANCVSVTGAGDAGQQSGSSVVSDTAVTIPSSSLVSSVSSVTSSITLAPITFSSPPTIMATKAVSWSTASPSAVQSPQTMLVSSSTSSLLPLSSQPAGLHAGSHRVVSNGPIPASSIPTSSLIHGELSSNLFRCAGMNGTLIWLKLLLQSGLITATKKKKSLGKGKRF